MQMTKLLAGAALVVASLATPAVAASVVYADQAVNLRAGPGTEYPRLVVIPGNVPVEINGCIDGWSWCDVSYGPERGWVNAGHLTGDYESRRVRLYDYAPRVSLPVIVFQREEYWGNYYRNRPFYTTWHEPAHPPVQRVVVRPEVNRTVVIHRDDDHGPDGRNDRGPDGHNYHGSDNDRDRHDPNNH